MAAKNGRKKMAQEILDLVHGELRGSDPGRRVERIVELCSDVTGTEDPTGKHAAAAAEAERAEGVQEEEGDQEADPDAENASVEGDDSGAEEEEPEG